MLRKMLIITPIMLMTASVFAQDSQAQNPYVAKMQSTFDQATNDATTQFQKAFPKPQAPVIAKNGAPQANTPPAEAPAPPPPKYVLPPISPQTPAAPAPNIYVAPGANSNTQNSNSTINPYR